LADAILELLESDIRGVINIGGSDYLSRYEFALAAADIFGFDRGQIRKTSKAELNMLAARPSKAGLKIDLMKSVLETRAMGVSEGLKKVHAGWR
jgi:dTDP-4-dehydrorhamnose reductase